MEIVYLKCPSTCKKCLSKSKEAQKMIKIRIGMEGTSSHGLENLKKKKKIVSS